MSQKQIYSQSLRKPGTEFSGTENEFKQSVQQWNRIYEMTPTKAEYTFLDIIFQLKQHTVGKQKPCVAPNENY